MTDLNRFQSLLRILASRVGQLVVDAAGPEIHLIEAKAAERVEGRTLNFKKVAPLLQRKFKHKEIRQILAANIPGEMPLAIDDYQLVNPVKHRCF